MEGINLGKLAESQGIKPLLGLGDAIKRAEQVVSATCSRCKTTYYTSDSKMAIVMCLRYHHCPDCLKS